MVRDLHPTSPHSSEGCIEMMTSTGQLESVIIPESSHMESQGPFHRVFIEREAFWCLPPALFDNVASEARDHCGT